MPDSLAARAANSDERIDIALVDGSILFREGILRILSGSRFRVACHVETPAALTQYGEAVGVDTDVGGRTDAPNPAVALISLPERWSEWLPALADLRRVRPGLRIVVLIDGGDPDCLRQCLRAGVDGVLLKSICSRALLNSLELVALGERVFPRDLIDLILPGGAQTALPVRDGDLRKLSRREAQILRGLVAGHSNKVIAAHLNITEATVKVHLKSILRKIGATNRTQAAIWALNLGVRPLETDRAA